MEEKNQNTEETNKKDLTREEIEEAQGGIQKQQLLPNVFNQLA